MLKPVRTIAPAELPVSLIEAKAHLRVEHADDDTRITDAIEGAVDDLDGCPGILGRAIITQTWAQKFPSFPAGGVLGLALAPVQSIDSIAYYDADNVLQTLASNSYTLFDDELGPFVTLASDAVWPASYDRDDAVRVNYVAGYGAAAAVPENIKWAIKLAVELKYDAPDEARTKALLAAYDRIVAKLCRVGF